MKTIRSLIIFQRYFNVQTWYFKRGNSFLKPVSSPMTFNAHTHYPIRILTGTNHYSLNTQEPILLLRLSIVTNFY